MDYGLILLVLEKYSNYVNVVIDIDRLNAQRLSDTPNKKSEKGNVNDKYIRLLCVYKRNKE